MKFDVVIGNPPYQGERQGTSNTTMPVYHNFMEAAYSVADKVELITPARFLFNAGRTPTEWNEKMLNDEHFKVLKYSPDGSMVFGNNVEIKGGVAISYRDANKVFGKIEIFTQVSELQTILKKVKQNTRSHESLSAIIQVATKFDLDNLEHDYPMYANRERRLSSNVLTFECFHDEEGVDDIAVYGVINNKRVRKYINKKYIDMSQTNIVGYKVILPKADGNGSFGEVVTKPEVIKKNSGYTHTFYGIGNFQDKDEANNTLSYTKTKFARTLLSIVKVTQNVNAETWKYVPLQDFTSKSDIDWSKSIHEIDMQLYKKYGLDDNEIKFIETNVKEMA